MLEQGVNERHFKPAERAYCWYCDCERLGVGVPSPPISWSGHAWFQCPWREENEKKWGRPILVNADGTPYDLKAGVKREREKQARLRAANLALSARPDGGALVKVVGDKIVKKTIPHEVRVDGAVDVGASTEPLVDAKSSTGGSSVDAGVASTEAERLRRLKRDRQARYRAKRGEG